METELGLVVSARDWSERLHRFTVDHGGARVRARILRPEDAVAEDYDVLLVDDVTSFLNRRLVQQVQSQGRSVVGVFDAVTNPAGQAFLEDLGVDGILPSHATAEEFVRAVSSFGTVERVARAMEVVEPGTDSVESGRGQLVVVASSSGGTGATEIAVALAHAFTTVKDRALLMDADDVVPAIAQRLGLALHPNIRTSIDAFLNQPDRVDKTFHSLRRSPIDVVAGIPNTQDWIELRPGDVVSLATDETARRSFVVANVSSRIEDLAFHGGAPRYALARGMISAADQLVAVAVPSPIGVARTLEWIAQVRVLAPYRPVHVVFNKAPRSAFKLGELTQEITRTYAPFSLTVVPEDRRVAEAAWAGELVRGGSFVKGVEQLAGALASLPAARAAS
ncbi:MAG: ParA family protein [Acidimicrobiia bacterium]|nr:ParA family protein [Acidimicrobiia bacterium]MDH5502795.1 ParA family protein [Acidimicrobiia bacterium]